MEEKISAAQGHRQVQAFWNTAAGVACAVAMAGLPSGHSGAAWPWNAPRTSSKIEPRKAKRSCPAFERDKTGQFCTPDTWKARDERAAKHACRTEFVSVRIHSSYDNGRWLAPRVSEMPAAFCPEAAERLNLPVPRFPTILIRSWAMVRGLMSARALALWQARHGGAFALCQFSRQHRPVRTSCASMCLLANQLPAPRTGLTGFTIPPFGYRKERYGTAGSRKSQSQL